MEESVQEVHAEQYTDTNESCDEGGVIEVICEDEICIPDDPLIT